MKVTKLKGGIGFKFGGSKTVYSTAKYIFLCVIDGKDTRIMADVDLDIPLLISKKEMKGRAFRLDLINSDSKTQKILVHKLHRQFYHPGKIPQIDIFSKLRLRHFFILLTPNIMHNFTKI